MSTARISGRLVICAAVLIAGACDKNNKPSDTGAISAMDRAGSGDSPGTAAEGPVDSTPLPGVDVSKLSADKQATFYKFLGSLKSPCGKAHSLRTSFTSDTSCKRAPFAVSFVVAMLEDEATDADVREFYKGRYETPGAKATLDLSKAPYVGTPDAPVKLVEFFDYACPACQHVAPILAEVATKSEGKVVEYFLMYPLEKIHPNSRSAAKAALAAQQQGKFKQMHELLFAKAPAHTAADVTGYAKALGLDAAKFDADYTAAEAHVASDVKQGEAAKVESTPTVYLNGIKYMGPMSARYLEMAITEEVAVNR
ncbi:MAG: DsbA family protein [Kofleriaceae bacterium]